MYSNTKCFATNFLIKNFATSIKKLSSIHFRRYTTRLKNRALKLLRFFLMADSKPTQKIFKIKDNLFASFLF